MIFKIRVSRIVLFSITMACTAFANADDRSTKEQAIALVKKAIVYYEKYGKEKSVTEFNRLDSPFNVKSEINPNGDMYMLLYTMDGVQPVHGKNPKIQGRNVLEMRDADGVYLIKELLKACQSKDGNGWVSYKWPHPISKQIEGKQTYVERAGDICIGTGIYR